MAYVIGVDCGTSGTKTVLFDEKGTVISSVTIEYPMYQPKNGYAEQDPADWANAMINTIKAVMTKSGVIKRTLQALVSQVRCTDLLCSTRTTTFLESP